MRLCIIINSNSHFPITVSKFEINIDNMYVHTTHDLITSPFSPLHDPSHSKNFGLVSISTCNFEALATNIAEANSNVEF